MSKQIEQNITAESEEVSLKELIIKLQDWWRYLLSKWLIILIIGLIGGVLGFFYAKSKKPVYTATTTFVLEDEKSGGGLGSLAGLASMAGVDLGGSGGGVFQGDNILGLYKSRTMVEQTLLTKVSIGGKLQLLIDRYIQFNELRDKWAEKPALKDLIFIEHSLLAQPSRLRDSVLGAIVLDLNRNYLSIAKPDIKLSTIRVEVKSNDEIFAKAFNDALVKNVNEFYVNTKTKKTLTNVQILQNKTDSVRSVMNGAIYTAVAVADATPNLNPTRQVQRIVPAQKAQFSVETNKAILAEMVKNLELTKMSLLKETPLIQVIDAPVYPLRIDKFGKARGIILGGLVFGFLTVIFLVIRKIFRGIME